MKSCLAVIFLIVPLTSCDLSQSNHKKDTADADRKKQEAKYQQQREEYERQKSANLQLDGLIQVRLVKLQYEWLNGQYGPEEGITFVIEVHNKSDKHIRAFEGLASFYDLFGEHLVSERVTNDETLNQFEIVTRRSRIKPFNNINLFRSLSKKTNDNVDFRWRTDKALFTDGQQLKRDVYLIY